MPAHRCWSYHAKNPPTVSSQLGLWSCIFFLHSWQNIYSTISQFSFSLTLWQQSTSKFQSNVNMNAKGVKREMHKKTQGLIENVLNFFLSKYKSETDIEKYRLKVLSISTINTRNSVILILYNFDLHLALSDSLVFSFEINLELSRMSPTPETKIISQR